jgi:hypothetical protein
MDRQTILQALLNQKKLKNYLEIGVFNGHIFFRINSNFKVAVDPDFRFDTLRKIGKTILNPYNIFNQYFEKTSDAFFEEDAARVFADKKIELSLIDGMHEYAYALRDIENTLSYLTPNGVIVIHDCNPLTKAAASSFAEWEARNFADTWNGDVWKAILYLRSVRKDVNAFVLDCDHGLGIVTYGTPEKGLSFTPDQIARFTYEDFNKNRAEWLNLKPADYFYTHFGLNR